MLNLFFKAITIFNRITTVIAMTVLFLMMMLTTVDVLGRFLFSKPIDGSFELTEVMLVIIVFCSMAFCQFSKGHINVDMIVRHFSKGTKKGFQILNDVLSLFVMTLIIWKSFENGRMVMQSNDVTMILGIPIYPFVFLVALGSAGMALEIIRDIIDTWRKDKA